MKWVRRQLGNARVRKGIYAALILVATAIPSAYLIAETIKNDPITEKECSSAIDQHNKIVKVVNTLSKFISAKAKGDEVKKVATDLIESRSEAGAILGTKYQIEFDKFWISTIAVTNYKGDGGDDDFVERMRLFHKADEDAENVKKLLNKQYINPFTGNK